MSVERRSGIAVAAIVLAAAAIGILAKRGSIPPLEIRAVAVPRGQLAINAYPWANVTRIRNVATGVAVELDGPIITPARPIDLAPGRYDITMRNPRYEDAITRTVGIAARRQTMLNVEFDDASRETRPMIGDLDAAERELTSMLGSSPSGEAYLLRGCTRYTRAMLSAEPDAGLAAARDDFNAALKLDRELRLDSRQYSPKLVAFFEEVRRGG